MHRVRHSEIKRETNSDFGVCRSVWDRLFGTGIAEPSRGQLGMVIGMQGLAASEGRSGRAIDSPIRADGQRLHWRAPRSRHAHSPRWAPAHEPEI
jgi:hypothetical protein